MERTVLLTSASAGFFDFLRGAYLELRRADPRVGLAATAEGWAVLGPADALERVRSALRPPPRDAVSS